MHLLLMVAALLLASAPALVASAQVFPDGYAETPYQCPPPENPREPQSEAARLELERRTRYRQIFPAYVSAMPATPDTALPMPVDGVQVAEVADTWGAPRGGGRVHQGQDIFAPAGTPIRSAAAGHIYRVGEARLGGNVVLVVGAGGRRYYYAHLSAFADIREGQRVGVGDLLGFVGNSGNAATTPPHLHFGVYGGDPPVCDWEAIDPLPPLVDRSP